MTSKFEDISHIPLRTYRLLKTDNSREVPTLPLVTVRFPLFQTCKQPTNKYNPTILSTEEALCPQYKCQVSIAACFWNEDPLMVETRTLLVLAGCGANIAHAALHCGSLTVVTKLRNAREWCAG